MEGQVILHRNFLPKHCLVDCEFQIQVITNLILKFNPFLFIQNGAASGGEFEDPFATHDPFSSLTGKTAASLIASNDSDWTD